ncbi:MAG: hypothetical protein NTX64_04645 [Elusimicrobia bacterium]|nr:hypothetical protein [Elusimicrobiota bacterium]
MRRLGPAVAATALMALSGASFAAEQGAKRWSDPSVPFTCDIPADWELVPKEGLHLVLRSPGAGSAPGIHADHYVDRKDGFGSWKDYVGYYAGRRRRTARLVAKPSPVVVGGREASRFERIESFMPEHPPRGADGGARPGRGGPIEVKNATVVVPDEGGFWVLSYSAQVDDFKKHLPRFQRLLSSLRWNAPPAP